MQTALILTESDLQEVLRPLVQQAVEAAFHKSKGINGHIPQESHTEYLTLKEAAKYLHISRSTFISLRKSGAFHAHPVGNRHLFRRSELDAFVQSQSLASTKGQE